MAENQANLDEMYDYAHHMKAHHGGVQIITSDEVLALLNRIVALEEERDKWQSSYERLAGSEAARYA